MRFRKEVIKKFEEPMMDNPDMELDDQLQFLKRDSYYYESTLVLFNILSYYLVLL